MYPATFLDAGKDGTIRNSTIKYAYCKRYMKYKYAYYSEKQSFIYAYYRLNKGISTCALQKKLLL